MTADGVGPETEPEQTHYAVLGVASDAVPGVIRAAYLRRARATHPDMGGTADEFAAVALAWSVLSDPAARALYDEQRARPGGGWGDDVGFDEPAPERARPGEPDEPPEPEGRVDAFDSVPLALPGLSHALSTLRPPPGPLLRRVLIGLGGAAVLLVLLGIYLHITDPSGTGVGLLVASYVFVVAAFAGLRALALPDGGSTAGGVATLVCCGTIGIAFAFMTSVAMTPGATATDPSAVTTGVVMLAWLVAGLAYLGSVRRTSRWNEWVARADELRARWEVAQSWNVLLRAREAAASSVLVREGVPDGRALVDCWVLRDGRTGNVLAVAHVQAPREWVGLLRAGGVDATLDWPTAPVWRGPLFPAA